MNIFATVGPSVNLSQLSMPLWGLCPTFRAAAGLSVNIPSGRRTIHQLFLRPRHSPSTSVNFLCICGTLRQFNMHPWDCSLTSVNFTCVPKPSGNFLFFHRTFRIFPLNFVHSWDLLLPFRGTMGPTATFSHISVWLCVYPSNFVNFPCGRGHSVNFLCVRTTSINFRHLSMHLLDLP